MPPHVARTYHHLRTVLALCAVLALTGLLQGSARVLAAIPLTSATTLPVPYLSQYQGLSSSLGDCGPTAVAMLLWASGLRPAKLSDAEFVQEVRDATGETGGTDFPGLVRALGTFGADGGTIAGMDAAKRAIANGQPVIALVDGTDLGRGSGYGDHWLVITGFSSDGQTVSLNDPDDQLARDSNWVAGGQVSIPVGAFQTAWTDGGGSGIIITNQPLTTTKPPSNLGATSRTPTSIILSWTAASGKGSPFTYAVYRDGTKVGSAPATSFADTGLQPGTQYTYTVEASDSGGHAAGRSQALAAQTAQVAVDFLPFAYQDMLGSAVDEQGLVLWTKQLGRGVTRTDVALGIAESDDYRTRAINAIYQTYLNRPADSDEVQNGLNALRGGTTYEQIRVGILGSQEYYSQAGGTPSGFVTRLYEDVLNRTPGTPELLYQQQQLTNGASRASIAAALVTSTEGFTDLVVSQYRQYLHRGPNTDEVNRWVSALRAGHGSDDQLVAQIIGSDEYEADAVTAYLQQVSVDLLGHTADPTLLTTYQAQLLSGTPAVSVVQSIESSEEYLGDVVASTYQAYLNSSPTPMETLSWVTALRGNATSAWMTADIMGSSQFFAAAGKTNADFIGQVYRATLHRTPNHTELLNWEQQMSDGASTSQVAYGILTSNEGLTDQVANEYQRYLHRAPDASESQVWVTALRQGTPSFEVVANLLASDEYFVGVAAHLVATPQTNAA